MPRILQMHATSYLSPSALRPAKCLNPTPEPRTATRCRIILCEIAEADGFRLRGQCKFRHKEAVLLRHCGFGPAADIVGEVSKIRAGRIRWRRYARSGCR